MPPGLKPKLKAIAEPIVAGIDPEGPDGHHRPAPARSKPFSATPASSLTPCRWKSSTPSSTPSKISWSTARPAIVNTSPARWPSCCARSTSDLAVVNGFKGGDWNELTETLNVRQKHAHSWVEAYAGLTNPDNAPVWITLDPTPVAERKQSIAQVGGLRRQLPAPHRFASPYLDILCHRLRSATGKTD